MADTHKVNTAITVVYQALGAEAGLSGVYMDVYDEAQAIDVAKSVSGMTEIDSEGRYTASFTPDAIGDWIVLAYNSDKAGSKAGPVVKLYEIGTSDVDTVDSQIQGISGDIGDLDTKLDSLSGDIDNLSGDVSALGSPAMVG